MEELIAALANADRLESRWAGGELYLRVTGDVSHAHRRSGAGFESFATSRAWQALPFAIKLAMLHLWRSEGEISGIAFA